MSSTDRKRKARDTLDADPDDPDTVPASRKHAATAKWRKYLELAEVIQMKGNFWNRCGFSRNTINYLYPEEALMLMERGQIYVEGMDGSPMHLSQFYEMVVSAVSLPVYLSYLKLKSLDYIVQRYDERVVSLTGNESFSDMRRLNPTKSLLSQVASFKIYNSENWSKRNAQTLSPCGIVVVVHGERMPGPPDFIQLLDECRGVPLVFTIMLSSGFVILQEFSNALESITWNPIISHVPAVESNAPRDAQDGIDGALEDIELEKSGAVNNGVGCINPAITEGEEKAS